MKSKSIMFATSLVIAAFGLLPSLGKAAPQQPSDASCCNEGAACCAPAAPCCAGAVQKAKQKAAPAAAGCCAPDAPCCVPGADCCG